MSVPSQAAFEISEVLQTGSERVCVHFVPLPCGAFGIELTRLNSALYGYQTAQVLVKRYRWGDGCNAFTELQLDSGRANYARFQIYDERDEVVVHVLQNHSVFQGGAPDGSARLVLKREADEQCLSGLATGLGGVMRATGAFRCSERPGRQIQESDADIRNCEVHVVGSGLASHWASVFCFEGGRTFVCELTATNDQGQRFSECDWIFGEVHGLDEFLRDRQCDYLEHNHIQIWTSPAELLQRCKTNPRNGEQYHLVEGNCQRWIRTLLVEGYNVPHDCLPIRAAVVVRSIESGVIAVGTVCAIGGSLAMCGAAVAAIIVAPVVIGVGAIALWPIGE